MRGSACIVLPSRVLFTPDQRRTAWSAPQLISCPVNVSLLKIRYSTSLIIGVILKGLVQSGGLAGWLVQQL